ncbi:RidA family protein [Streptomyces sp. JB150]|nr:RidA family protein [Streptomyces sp. JB150]QIJ62086.1 RidA family protein [Streptomyces sp. JB150]
MIQRVTVPELFPPPRYAHASVVEAGAKLAFLAGAVPLDAEGKLVGEGDPVRQARQVIANLERQLAAVGSHLTHVVATDVYVVSDEPSVLSRVWDVVEASGLSTGPHSSTLIGVACLGYTGQLVEITATAVVPEHTGTQAPAEERISGEAQVSGKAQVFGDTRLPGEIRP